MTETAKRIRVTISPQSRQIRIAQPARNLGADIRLEALPVRVIELVDWYEGEYEVDPRFVQQTLETQNKGMRRDLEVNAIRVAVAQNPQGGNTVYIGRE